MYQISLFMLNHQLPSFHIMGSNIGLSSSKYFVIHLTNNTISPWNVRGIQLLGIDGFISSNINIKIKANLSDEKSAIEFDQNNVNGVIYIHIRL